MTKTAKQATASRWFAIAWFLCAIVLAGCSSLKTAPPPRESTAEIIPNSARPDLLYILATPHARLCVEVDAVQGCEPHEAQLQRLRSFLSANCNKPGGIEIVRSDVIPVKAARGLSVKTLARKYLNGPGKISGSSPAFLYVLFYNDALCTAPMIATAGHAATGTTSRTRRETAHPYTDLLPYPAIHFNTRYLPFWARNLALLHEAGHALGLVRRPTSTSTAHCPDPSCLMNTSLSFHRVLLGRQRKLCPLCRTELLESSMQKPPPVLRFSGAALVRSEPDYHIVALPGRVSLVLGDLSDQDCEDYVGHIRRETYSDDDWRMDFQIKDDAPEDPAEVDRLIDHIKADPSGLVRTLGPRILVRMYCSRGRYTNAIALLEQAILLNSKDAWSYNQLGWIRATCPDASVLNGTQAVAAATKACELTEWKDWHYVDTLAAACAEAGDFKRALELEEQASRSRQLSASEQQSLQEHISLFKASQPFREKPAKP